MSAFPHITFAARSDIGRRRANNEDAFGVFPEAGIFCVADGMGGGDDGEIASAATVDAVERFTRECPLPEKYTYPVDGIVAGIRTALNSASAWIANRTRQKGLKGCGSTFVCICFDAAKPNVAVALHAGDSRLYRIRGRSIVQMTVDHSAAELIGAKSEKDVNPMFRGMILRAVGIQPSVELERTEVQLKAGDRILICSDGLSRMVSDKKILSIIRDCTGAEDAVDRLVEAANNAGGVDNITAVLIAVGELPEALPMSPLNVGKDGAVAFDTVDEPMDDAVTQRTMERAVSAMASTEDDFVPPTASGSMEEVEDESIDIPESDTEDDPPSDNPAPSASADVSWTPLHPHRLKCAAYRLMTNWIFLSCLFLLLLVFCSIAACVHSRTKEEAEKKEAAEAKIHQKEQKTSLQAVESRRKSEQEQMERAKEDEKIRIEIQTHAKQKEVEERAKNAAERRDREEKAAREKAAADAMREKEAKAQEVARQEELRKAEEQRLMKEQEEARAKAARAEAARKEKERLAREESARLEKLRKADEAKAQAEKQDQAIKAFMTVVEDGTAARFHARIKNRIPNSIPPDLYRKLLQAGNSKLSRTDQIAAIVALTKDVQQLSRKLEEYSPLMLEDVDCDLADASNDKQTKDLLERRNGIVAFSREAGAFADQDASDPDTHLKCARMIRFVPKWFDF